MMLIERILLIVITRILIFDIKLRKFPLEAATLRFQVMKTVHAAVVRMGTSSIVFIDISSSFANLPLEFTLGCPRRGAFLLM